jgi:predicted dithiol-disulfide oxidoreductase (DUF899 family)
MQNSIPHPPAVSRDEWLTKRKKLLEQEKQRTRERDQTPCGRQEDFEDSPEGWPQKPTYG